MAVTTYIACSNKNSKTILYGTKEIRARTVFAKVKKDFLAIPFT